MGDVVILAPLERTPTDLDRLLALNARASGGAKTTELEHRLEELAERLSRLSAAFRDSRMDRVASTAREAAETARALGLNRAFRVGQSIASLSQGTDSVALAANVARLMRLGELALSTVWQHQDSHY